MDDLNKSNKRLPERSTRNKRLTVTESDDEFYNNEFWQDDQDDSEWTYTSNSSINSGSDFELYSTSSDSDSNENDIDKKLIKSESKTTKRKQNYQKLVNKRIQKAELSSRQWSLLEGKIKIGKNKYMTQEIMMKEAEKREKQNVAIAENLLSDLNDSAASQMKQFNYTPINGYIVSFFSWCSNRTIAEEEIKKSQEQLLYEATLHPYERQLLTFYSTTTSEPIQYPSFYSKVIKSKNMK